MANLSRAVEIAAKAHADQRDKAGQPYILHPLRVMMQVESEEERVVAVLHDLVEDTSWTLDALREEGFSETILAALDLVTRKNGDSYEEFVDRLEDNPIARRVKIADLNDNMDVRRLASVGESDLERFVKYHAAWKKLTGEESRNP